MEHQTKTNVTTHKRFLTTCILGCMFLISLPGCSKKDENPADTGPTIPVLTTDTVTAILTNAATCGGTITSDGGAPVTRRGVCWSKASGPQITDAHTEDGTGTGSYTSPMTGLDTNTFYYVRAYATNSKGTAYGNTRSFETLKSVVYGLVKDIDSNIYHVVKVGTQYWLRENLRVTHYRNGDDIPNVPGDTPWKTLTTGAYCIYDNQVPNDTTFGNLYNWHALSDSRGLCPADWHVPSDAEWTTMGDFLGGNSVAGGKLKSTGTIEGGTGLWYAPNTDATNSRGFTGLPGGYRINYGTFYSLSNVGYFWSSTDTASVNAWNFVLDANNGNLKRIYNLKTNGFSIRCCRD